MIVCVCKAVRDRDLKGAIARGARTLEDLGRATGAGTDCGTCIVAVEDLLEEYLPAAARPPSRPADGPSV